MNIVGNTAWVGKWFYRGGYPYEIHISIDRNTDEFVIALNSNYKDFDVVDRAGTVVTECRVSYRPSFFHWLSEPDFLIKDVTGKCPTITLSKSGWMTVKITWNGHEGTFRLCRRHEHIELLGVDLNVDRKSFHAVCERTSLELPTYMLVAVLYFAWVRFSQLSES